MRRFACICVATAVLGCGEETPTGVGGPLLPPDAVQTFEVVLDASDYLVSETSFSGYTDIQGGDFQVVARGFEDVFSANTLARFDIPEVVAIPDTGGVVQTDSTPTFVAGRVVLRIDTLRSDIPGDLRFRLAYLEEEWDPATATWTLRIDSASVQLPWAQPGAESGAEIATLDWILAGEDSVVIPVDSLTIVAWSDTSNRGRGAVISLLTDGARIRLADVVLRLDARSEIRPDTLFTNTVRPPDPTFVHDPVLPDPASGHLVSGSPGWRAFFEFMPDMGALTVACPTFPGCRVRLDETAVSYAAFLLEPIASPAGFLPQDSLAFETRAVYASDRVPLARSPLGVAVGRTADRYGPDRFSGGAGADVIEMPVTGFMSAAASADTAVVVPSLYVALLPLIEGFDLGVAAFRMAPRLRLVLTTASELQLR